MATVHLGRLLGPVGFSRTVAIKRLHTQYAKDAEFVAMFLDEARLVARIRHPNVVPTLDVVQADDELLLVMEYVQGEALSKLVRRTRAAQQIVPFPIVAGILTGVLHGLHAAHEARGEKGEPLDIVHRDVSPQNIIVGVDGVARLLDFGVAKATQRSQSTRDGQVKGKVSYMAPEQLSSDVVDRRADVFSAGVVLWEALTSTRLFAGATDARVMAKILAAEVQRPRDVTPSVPEELDVICMCALSRDPADRFQTARDMALAIEKASPLATASEVGAWVESVAHDAIEARVARVHEIESRSNVFAREDAATGDDASARSAVRRTGGRSALVLGGAAVAVAVVIAAVAIGARVFGGHDAAPAASAASAAASTPAAPVAPPPPETVTVYVDKPAPPPASATPSATVAATHAAPAVHHKAAVHSTRNACREPFYVDSSGIKHIKPECL